MTDSLWERTERAIEAIRELDDREPSVALVLGSGLGDYADDLDDPTSIPYDKIPGFAVSTVSGHSGQLVIGNANGLTVAVMKGRVHLYEGYTAQDVTFPLRVLWRLGARRLIITNSAGGLGHGLEPGDLTVISDHLNLTGQNPLIGENDDRFGPRFPDMTGAYDADLQRLAREVAASIGVTLKSGVYAGLTGPTYETPGEVTMVERLGGHLVGMSTVLEVIVARHMGMRVLGVTCVSNLAAGLSEHPLTHSEVEEIAGQAAGTFRRLIDGVIRRLAKQDQRS